MTIRHPGLSELSTEQALEQVRAELLAMPEGHVLRATRASPWTTAASVEAAVLKTAAHRDALIALCGERARTVLDGLPIYARAVVLAAIEARATAPGNNIAELHDAVRDAYDLIITELNSLVMRKVLDASVIAPARGIRGYAKAIESTRVAVFVARKHWGTIVGKTQLTEAILHEADGHADRLQRAIIDRDHRVSRAPAIELRARALSKLLSEYDELRRMLTYLRWHQGDYDELAPSPFANRRRARRAREEDEDLGAPAEPPSPSDGPPFTS